MLRLKNILCLEQRNNKAFTASIIKSNADRIISISPIIIIIETMMLLLSLLSPAAYDPHYISYYRLAYMSLILASLILLAIGLYHRFGSAKKRVVILGIYFISFFGLAWGGFVTLLDQASTGQISVYLTFIFLIALGVIYHPLDMLIIYTIIHLGFLFLAPYFQSNEMNLISIQINASLFIFFAWLFQRSNYLTRYREFNRQLELEKIGQTDGLTGLYNRLYLDHFLNEAFPAARKEERPFTVLLCDINNFKNINDSYGHLQGDNYIKECASIMTDLASLHQGTAFRYGGDEFLMITQAPIQSPESTLELALKKLLANSKYEDLSLTCGIYSNIPRSTDDPWDYIHQADQGLYKQKRAKTGSS